MDCTIIIPNYNYGQFVGEAIKSALKQTVPCEVIVVDDGSTDASVEEIQKYPVKLICQQNSGLSNARNTGIRAATTEWILPLDSDDTIHPTFLEKTIGKGDIVATGMRTFGKENKEYVPPQGLTYKNFRAQNNIYSCSLFKKEVWEKVGGYDEDFNGYEDWFFWLKATYAGYKIAVVREYLFNYRRHGRTMIHEVRARDKELQALMKQKLPQAYGV